MSPVGDLRIIMHKAKLTQYQLDHIMKFIDRTYDEIGDAVLDKWKVSYFDQLNHSDYDDIIEFMQETLFEINSAD